VRVSKYEYRIKSDIKKKLKTFTELEIPLLIEKGIIDSFNLSIFNQNLRISPQSKVHNYSQLTSNFENCAQNMMARKGLV